MPGNLIYYALILIAIALVAALLGFGGVSATAMSGASLLVWVAVIVIVVGVVFALIRRAELCANPPDRRTVPARPGTV